MPENVTIPGSLKDIRTRQAEVQTALTDLELIEEPTDEDSLRTDALIEEGEMLEEAAKPLQERADKIASLRESFRAGGWSSESGADETDLSDQGASGPQFKRAKIDPFADLDGVRNGLVAPSAVRSRALAAVDQFSKRADVYGLSDEAAEEVTRKLEKNGKTFGTNFARQMLTTGAPEYLAAFEQYINDPGGYASRAALSLTAANGGYLVPFTLDPTIILTNNGSRNPYRDNATIKTTTTNDWNGVTSAGVSAEWTAEGIEAADASPTVGNLKITPQKADAYLFGSFEVLSDSDFASQLPMLLADAKDRLEETAFAVGSGTLQPWGVITRGTTVAAASGTAATGPTAASVYTLMGSLPARWRGPTANNVFLAPLSIINILRNVPAFTGATTSIVNDSGPVPTLLGVPLLESTSVSGTLANASKVLAYLDMRQYYIVDRVGMSVVYDPIVLGANRRPTGQGAWYAFWRTGADVSTTAADRVLTLTT
jgi:HK97 family phage major capsid protein